MMLTQEKKSILGVSKKSGGHYVCREAWLRFLGIGKQRLVRTKRRHRGVDERTLNFGYLLGLAIFETVLLSMVSLNKSLYQFQSTFTWITSQVSQPDLV